MQIGLIGEIDAADKHSHGYYKVEFKSSPHKLQ